MDLHFASQAWHFATRIVTLRGRRGTYGTGLAPVARLGLVWHRGRRRRLRGRRGTSRDRLSLCGAAVAFRDMDVHSAWKALLKLRCVCLRNLRVFPFFFMFLLFPASLCATSATPATQSDDPCREVPPLPRKVEVHVAKYHACHANGGGDHGAKRDPSAPLPPARSGLPSRRPHNLLTHTHNLLTTPLVHTTSSHTTCHHTTCSHTQFPHTQLVTTQLAHTQLTHTHTTCPNTTYSHTTCSHTTCHHTTCSHTTYSHTTCPHTTCHHTTCPHTTYSPRNLSTHNLLTHNMSPHNLLTHNLLTHNLSTHNLLTHNLSTHNLLTTQLVHTQLTHTQLVYTQLVTTQLVHTQLTHHTTCPHAQLTHTHNMSPHNLLTYNFLTHNLSTHNLLTVWQARHLATWTCTLHGRRGTWQHGSSLCVAGVALMALGWLRWRAWVAVDVVDAAAVCMAGVALGDIGTWRHRPSLCVAGVALGDIDLHFAWQAWHLWHWTGSGGALGSQLTPWTPRRFMDLHFAWQAWLLATWTCTLRGRRGTWRHGRCGTYGTGLALVARLGPSWRRGCLRARHGTWWHWLSLCVAGVALVDIEFHFAWQACDFVNTQLVHTIFDTSPCHTPSFTLTIFDTSSFTHHLSHTTLSHSIFHTPSLTRTLSHTIFHTPSLTHHLSHTIFHTPSLTHIIFDTPSSTNHFVTHHCWLFDTTSFTPLCRASSFTHPFVTHHLSHTIFDTSSFTHHLSHHFVTCHLSHTVTDHLSHTIFDTPLCHTPSLTHHLSHTTWSHTIFHLTIFHTQLCHTPSFTHHFVTHHLSPHHLSHTTLSHTIYHTPFFTHNFVTHHLSHTTLSHTIFHTQLCHTHTPSFLVTHQLSHTTVSHTHILFYFSVLHHLLCLSFLPRPATTFVAHYSWLEEVDLWGYPALQLYYHYTKPRFFLVLSPDPFQAPRHANKAQTSWDDFGGPRLWRYIAVTHSCDRDNTWELTKRRVVSLGNVEWRSAVISRDVYQIHTHTRLEKDHWSDLLGAEPQQKTTWHETQA